MPAFANIVINDGAGTPVAHTFGPAALEGLKSSFADRAGGITVGFPTIEITSWLPGKGSHLHKVRAKVVLPVLEVSSSDTYAGIAPAPTKAYDMTAVLEFYLPERSTLQNRKDIRAFASNLCANAIITSLVETQETVY